MEMNAKCLKCKKIIERGVSKIMLGGKICFFGGGGLGKGKSDMRNHEVKDLLKQRKIICVYKILCLKLYYKILNKFS